MPDIKVDADCLPGCSALGCAGSSEKKLPRFCSSTPEAGSTTQAPKSKYRLCTMPTALPSASATQMNVVSLPEGGLDVVRGRSPSQAGLSSVARQGASSW